MTDDDGSFLPMRDQVRRQRLIEALSARASLDPDSIVVFIWSNNAFDYVLNMRNRRGQHRITRAEIREDFKNLRSHTATDAQVFEALARDYGCSEAKIRNAVKGYGEGRKDREDYQKRHKAEEKNDASLLNIVRLRSYTHTVHRKKKPPK